jgi:serine protease AprX
MNLSWGTASTQDPKVDPLNYAVERLWLQGIAVVVAAGNSGPQSGTITKPGDDPMVITVGSYDDKQNTDTSDDSLSSWSSQGPTSTGLTKPDVVAPGRFIIAARSFGSSIEGTYPKALRDPSYIRGSGSSEAAAVTSGLLALMAQAHPAWTPDQMKVALKSTAKPIAGVSVNGQGAGRVQLNSALATTPGAAVQQASTAGGLGSIEQSRGGSNVQAICGGTATVISGEIDAQCNPWTPSTWTGTSWTGTSWTGTSWTGTSWTGSSWNGTSWTGSSWNGTSWTGTSWTGTSWTGSSWNGTSWTGTSWTGTSWTGTSWTGTSWTGTSWTSSGYDDFLTAFWGNHPAPGRHLPGETDEIVNSPRKFF